MGHHTGAAVGYGAPAGGASGEAVTPVDRSTLRRLRLFLRDHRVLTADARVAGGQDLFTYLTSRTRYVNLTGVEFLGTHETVDYMALKVDRIMWAASENGDLELTHARGARSSPRVELELEGGYLLAAGLLLVQDQRLSDYLRSAPAFIPLCDAELSPRGKTLGDVVVNQDAIQVVREMRSLDESGSVEEGDLAGAGEPDDVVESEFESADGSPHPPD